MNREIEEMAKVIYDEFDGMIDEANATSIAAHLTRKNYRKSTDVAREIFEDIEKVLSEDEQDFERLAKLYQDEAPDYARIYVADLRERFAELRKKYESEGEE